MIKYPGETLSNSFTNTDGIVKEIEFYYMSGEHSQLVPIYPNMDIPVYALVAGTGCKAKAFGYPVLVDLRGVTSLVTDCRSVTAVSSSIAAKVTNQGDFDTINLVAGLTSKWNSTAHGYVEGMCADVMPIFATWMGSTLSATFNLELDQRTDITIVAALYFLSQLDRGVRYDMVLSQISKELKIDFDRVSKVGDECTDEGKITDLNMFIECLKKTSGGIRLTNLDVPVLYQTTSGVWMGALGRTFMQIAIEYPPYILALTAISLSNQSYRRCKFFEYVKMFDRRPELRNLVVGVERILNNN